MTMATSQSTTNEPGSRRTPSSSERSPLPPLDEDVGLAEPRSEGFARDGGYLFGPAYEAIETERARLMAVDSVLACLEIAMDLEAVTTEPPPYFPDVVQIARKLINRSIRGLDCREIGPLIDRDTTRRN
jgi:hypothetical protein